MYDHNRRKAYILQYLVEHGRATIKELAEYCSVSPRTIQRDINKLTHVFMISADQGFGGAHYLVKNPRDEMNKLSPQQLCVLNEVLFLVTKEKADVIRTIIDKFWTYRL